MISSQKGFSALFPTPRYLLLSTAGLVIADDEVRVLELGLSSRSELKVLRFDKFSLPEHTIQAGFVNDQEALKAALANVAHSGTRYVHVTLPEERTYLFTATIDKVPDESLRDAVAFILEENVPLPLANAVFDFVVVDAPSPDKLRVAVSVLSKKAIDFYVELFAAAGLTPVSFSVESQATARALLPRGEKGTALIVKLWPQKTGLYVASDGAVQFSTTLPYGASSRPTDLKAEILKVVGFWNARAVTEGSHAIGSALLCGPVELAPEIAQEILRESGLSIAPADPWINAPVDEASLPPELATRPLAYSATIGGAIGAGGDRLFKLLTEEGKKEVEKEYSRRRGITALCALSFALFVGLVGLLPTFVLARARAADAETGSTLSEEKSAESAALANWLALERRKLAALSSVTGAPAPSALIRRLLALKPAGIRLAEIDWSSGSGGSFSLAGTASSREALLALQTGLEASGDYAEVSLPLSTLAKEKDIPFEVKLSLKSSP